MIFLQPKKKTKFSKFAKGGNFAVGPESWKKGKKKKEKRRIHQRRRKRSTCCLFYARFIYTNECAQSAHHAYYLVHTLCIPMIISAHLMIRAPLVSTKDVHWNTLHNIWLVAAHFIAPDSTNPAPFKLVVFLRMVGRPYHSPRLGVNIEKLA